MEASLDMMTYNLNNRNKYFIQLMENVQVLSCHLRRGIIEKGKICKCANLLTLFQIHHRTRRKFE